MKKYQFIIFVCTLMTCVMLFSVFMLHFQVNPWSVLGTIALLVVFQIVVYYWLCWFLSPFFE